MVELLTFMASEKTKHNPGHFMTATNGLSNLLRDIGTKCPAGYAIALHVRFTTPTFLFQTYSKDWMDFYSSNGLVLQDPTVRFGFENTGTRRWSDLTGDDDAGVMEKAAKYGLVYGFVCALDTGGSKSMASFARDDREFTDSEIAKLSDLLSALHDATTGQESLSDEDRATLKQLSISLTHA